MKTPIMVQRFPLSLMLLVHCILSAGCQSGRFSDVIHIPSTHPGTAVFEDTVKPVLEHRCIQCHNTGNPNGGLNFQDRESVFAGNSAGPFLVPGKPDQSSIWLALNRPTNHPHTMPQDGWGMDIDELEAFKAWIDLGASWPKNEAGQLQIKEYRVTRRDYL